MQVKSAQLSQLQSPLSDVFNFKKFGTYLMTKAGGSNNSLTAKSITSDLIEFFHTTPQSSKQSNCKIERLLNRSNLELFVDYIKHNKKYKPIVIFEKIQRLKIAIRYIMSLTNSKDYCTSGWSLLKLLTDLQQSQKFKAISKWSSVESDHDEMVGLLLYMHVPSYLQYSL